MVKIPFVRSSVFPFLFLPTPLMKRYCFYLLSLIFFYRCLSSCSQLRVWSHHHFLGWSPTIFLSFWIIGLHDLTGCFHLVCLDNHSDFFADYFIVSILSILFFSEHLWLFTVFQELVSFVAVRNTSMTPLCPHHSYSRATQPKQCPDQQA